eukprot:5663489-Pleurochrysis_carterae.AAC.1
MACAATISLVPASYRLEGTGFTKVTVALNNPSPVHTDYANLGQTFLISFDVSAADSCGVGVSGGSH